MISANPDDDFESSSAALQREIMRLHAEVVRLHEDIGYLQSLCRQIEMLANNNITPLKDRFVIAVTLARAARPKEDTTLRKDFA